MIELSNKQNDVDRQLSNSKEIIRLIKKAFAAKMWKVAIIAPFEIKKNDKLPLQIIVDRKRAYVCIAIQASCKKLSYKIAPKHESVPIPKFID